jgi:kinetochore protein Spc7/SPC105
MNFNNPDDVYSSSPLSGDNSSPGGMDVESGSESESESESDVDVPENLNNAPDTEDSSQSSARLDAALRQASALANTQRLDFDDDDGDMTMDMAEEEMTAAFKPWARKSTMAQENKENDAPSSPAGSDGEDEDDMSMDITRAVGRIVEPEAQSSDVDDDMSMELTMPLGSIQSAASKAPANRRKSLKRRVSMLDASQGSPAKRSTNRRTSLRQRRKSDENASQDATMDLTMAIGGIKSNPATQPQDAPAGSPDSDAAFDDATMDFTLAVGSIKQAPAPESAAPESEAEEEDFTMEFTRVVGPGIKHLNKPAATPEKPAAVMYPTLPELSKEPTPEKLSTPAAPVAVSSKTPTPRKSTPRKSPKESPQTQAKADIQATPTKPSPTGLALDPGTPEFVRQKPAGDVEPSPFVRRTPRSATRTNGDTSTPTSQVRQKEIMVIPDDPIAAPILNRRRSSLSSVQFSPLNAPREELTLKSTTSLSDSIKLLSTPRKASLMSPAKRGTTPKSSQSPMKQPTPKQKTPTPKKTQTPKKTSTPKQATPKQATPKQSASPKKRVVFGEQPDAEEPEEDIPEEVSDVERISLQEFLDMTKIRFMDLSTTKRRHTAAPAAFHDVEVEEGEESLDRYVVAGACTVPEYELYQHACHEMKKYISDGRHFVRTMEANVMEENPLLFSEYLTAPPDQRIVMDNQFKNLKTNARLEARGEWYTWRSTLLQDLKSGLLGTLDGFKKDEDLLDEQARLLDIVLPPLVENHTKLSAEQKQLQQRHDELNSCNREELEQTREQLIAATASLEEKKKLLLELQQELANKEKSIQTVKDHKVECIEETKAAERVREECRGWSTSEVTELKSKCRFHLMLIHCSHHAAKVSALEQAHGWSITSASAACITMTYLNDLELYFQPSAFAAGSASTNGPISLAYVGDSATPHPRPLTTSKRFFLQLIRAQLHCIPQAQTVISELLSMVKNGWAAALAVADGVSWLEHNYVTDEFILSDERMAISANMLLPSLQTKVRVTFDIGVTLGSKEVTTEVDTKAEVVYGEKYGEEKMGAFLRDFCGTEVDAEKDMTVWADGMLDLAARLRKTGRKGERK